MIHNYKNIVLSKIIPNIFYFTLGMSDSQSDPALFPLTSAIVYLIAFMLVCSVTLGQMAQRWPSGPCYMKGPSINNVIIFPQISYPSVLFDHSLLDLLPPPFFNSLPPALQGKKCFWRSVNLESKLWSPRFFQKMKKKTLRILSWVCFVRFLEESKTS